MALAGALPGTYPGLATGIGDALFEHLEPYRADPEDPADDARILTPGQALALSEPVHVVIGPLGGRLTVEIGYRTPWDCEHTLGARFVDWQLVELNGSVTGH